MNIAAKKEEILKEVPFLKSSDKWGGVIQVIRVTVLQDDGSPDRVFINKRLMFTGSSRYINLPRNGIEEVIKAIVEATEVEREAHEAVLTHLNERKGTSRAFFQERKQAQICNQPPLRRR